jgi:hypothetical protein
MHLQELDEKAAQHCEDEDSEYGAYVWYFRSNIHGSSMGAVETPAWMTSRDRRCTSSALRVLRSCIWPFLCERKSQTDNPLATPSSPVWNYPFSNNEATML